jgi:hypothetical protein
MALNGLRRAGAAEGQAGLDEREARGEPVAIAEHVLLDERENPTSRNSAGPRDCA